MKKVLCGILAAVMLLMLTGCNEEEKAALQAVIDQVVQAEETYTPNSYEEYISALENAKTVKDNGLATVGQITEAQERLQTAIDGLYPKPDKSALTQKKSEAEAIDKTQYLPNSATALKTAIGNAETVLADDNAVKQDVDAAVTQIDNGIDALVVKPDKTDLAALIKKANDLNKMKYTTSSCSAIQSVISSTSAVMNDENATQQEVDQAVKKINDGLNAMVRATKGIYRINCSLTMVANNSVGNEWSKGITYNGDYIHSGDTITAPLSGSITITGAAVESDSIPDYGSGSVSLPLGGGERSTQFYVRENRGRYSGNIAIWELECSAELIERI